MGHFDVTRFEVEGRPHYLVATPASVFPTEKAQKLTNLLGKVASAQGAVFGGLPYQKYVYFYFFRPAESGASAGLEHLNSQVIFFSAGQATEPEKIVGGVAHEFFHLWNVKRIRPAEMWPYDYSSENETPLLWLSEGFTNYYGDVTLYRLGLMSRKDFLDSVEGSIGGVENTDARAYISPADASVTTWLRSSEAVRAFGISYYTQGQNLAALLDLSIRHDTGGSAGLDDLMRGLYRDFYLRGRGFTTEDLIGVINRLTRRDYHDFFRRYVWGVEVPPYETIFGYAGLRVDKTARKTFSLGLGTKLTDREYVISRVAPDKAAAAAGLLVGDVLEKVNGKAPFSFRWQVPGDTVQMTIRRAGERKEIPFTVGSRDAFGYNLVESPGATPEQVKVREGWLGTSK
jgi:predicted metalloprotease with PDZ domain